LKKIEYQVNDVLNFVRIKPLELKEHAVSKIIDSALTQIYVPPEITIKKPDTNICLRCDNKKIETVFVNLITNAIQAIGTKGTINIRITEQMKEIMIEVEDSGDGIPDDVLPKNF